MNISIEKCCILLLISFHIISSYIIFLFNINCKFSIVYEQQSQAPSLPARRLLVQPLLVAVGQHVLPISRVPPNLEAVVVPVPHPVKSRRQHRPLPKRCWELLPLLSRSLKLRHRLERRLVLLRSQRRPRRAVWLRPNPRSRPRITRRRWPNRPARRLLLLPNWPINLVRRGPSWLPPPPNLEPKPSKAA